MYVKRTEETSEDAITERTKKIQAEIKDSMDNNTHYDPNYAPLEPSSDGLITPSFGEKKRR